MNETELYNEFGKFIDMYKRELKISGEIIEIDLRKLSEFDYKLSEEIIDKPRDAIQIINEAIKEKLMQNYHLRLIGADYKPINKIRVSSIGKLYSIKGNIKRVTKVMPRTTEIVFTCDNCGTSISVLQDRKKKKEPKGCSCSNWKRFTANKEIRKNVQEINLEELQEEIGDRQPQQIRVYLEEDLTDDSFTTKLIPGKKVEIVGIIETLPPFMTISDSESNLTDFMMAANNVIPLENEEELIISEEDENKIKEIAKSDPLGTLAKSLAPEIYGNEKIKKAMVLQMARGVSKERSDGSMTREDIHILLSGDPGIAKSVTLQAVNKITPKSRMVIGTKTSRVGLSAMAVKDEITNSWSLEVGSLVLANNSTLVIDEIDKMNKENLSELYEPMASSSVTINKAGIYAHLPARTSILASANPIHGNYDLNQSIAKQIDLPSPLLNRFDLIFILLDKPDKDFDERAVAHIFKSHKEKMKPTIQPDLFKKYINYCRRINPVLGDEILEYLQKFYISLRQRSKDAGRGLPINLRNMEALIRLSEANAKLRLSEVVGLEDVFTAKEIFMFSLKQIGIDLETGIIDLSRITEKVPVGKRGKMETIKGIILGMERDDVGEISYFKILEKAKQIGFVQQDIDDCLYELNKIGEIINPKSGKYKVVK